MKILKYLTVIIFSASLLSAQPSFDQKRWWVGLRMGAQTTESFNTVAGFNTSDVSRFKIGPTAEYDVTEQFSGEIDILYKELRFDALIPQTVNQPTSVSTTSGHIFDFPLLVKWRPLGRRVFTPFAGAGVAFRYTNSTETRRFFTGADQSQKFDSSFAQTSSGNAGFVLSGGFDVWVFDRARLSPELRWTAWGKDNFDAAPTIPTSSTERFKSQNNQLELLFGVTF